MVKVDKNSNDEDELKKKLAKLKAQLKQQTKKEKPKKSAKAEKEKDKKSAKAARDKKTSKFRDLAIFTIENIFGLNIIE